MVAKLNRILTELKKLAALVFWNWNFNSIPIAAPKQGSFSMSFVQLPAMQ
jgi:hypothetical protein